MNNKYLVEKQKANIKLKNESKVLINILEFLEGELNNSDAILECRKLTKTAKNTISIIDKNLNQIAILNK